ncbi:type II toxin-antitoxin system VapC family toxin [Pseudomonas farris]
MNKPKMFLDTQILIGAIQNQKPRVQNSSISSIVASEFLGTLGADPINANYYIPIIGQRHMIMTFPNRTLRRSHPFSKHHTDSVKMEFGGLHPTIIHFGNYAISEIINSRSSALFDNVISHLTKEKRKTTKKKFSFLLDQNIECIPFTNSAIVIAQQLLNSLKEAQAPKQNFRNSWNDLLIAATAIESAAHLYTNDKLLIRQIAEHMKAITIKNENSLLIDFSAKESQSNRLTRESKGYINQGWRVEFSKQRYMEK